jgi:LmbE family N-acetylglucosaminyl deacetylase
MVRLLGGVTRGRVLAIGAHPDDIELGAGGLLARLAREGARVVMAVLSVPTQAEERTAEARRAAELIGAELVLVHGADPVRVEDLPMHRSVARLDAIVGELEPQLVLTHSVRDVHWDHQLVHNATVSSLRRTPCDLLAFTSTPELNAASNFLGECFADISETIEVKLEAVAAHRSQVAKKSVDVESCRDLARALGRLSGVRYAECFEVLRLRL